MLHLTHHMTHKVCTLEPPPDNPAKDMPAKDAACRSFQATRWTLIRRVSADDSVVRRDALADLLRLYRPPMIRFVESRGCSRADAEDTVHAFIESKMLAGDFFEKADPKLGRLRTLLRVSLRHFLIDRWRKEQGQPLPAADVEALMDNNAERTHQHVFDREWARQVLQRAYEDMVAWCVKNHRHDYLAIFNARVWEPIQEGARLRSYAKLKEAGVIESVRQAQDALVNAKRLYKRCLITVVEETLSSGESIEEELQHLHRVLASEA